MSTELATLGNNAVEINKAFGFNNKIKPSIPILKINGADEEVGTAPKGTFVYDDGEKVLYSSEVNIRSFVKAYQYRIWDGADKSKNDMSTIEFSFKGEFRSMSGRFACGKMNKKKFLSLGDGATAQQKYLQENTKCKLLVFGLLSGVFTDLDTKAQIEVKDELFSWVVSQSGFMPIDQAISGIEKERRAVPLTPVKLTLKKEKQGSVTYFVPLPVVQNITEKLEVERDSAYLVQIKDFIKDTNEFVNNKFNSATKAQTENDNFAEVSKTIDGKFADDPLNDL